MWCGVLWWATQQLTEEEQVEMRQLTKDMLRGSHSRSRSFRDMMVADLEVSRKARKQFAELREQRRTGAHLARVNRAQAFNQRREQAPDAGSMLCSGPTGCLSG